METTQDTYPFWQETEMPSLPSLSAHEAVDVCVIGGGIAGLTTAYHLLEEGRSVAVLEKSDFRQGETFHTSAHLSTVLDERYFALRPLHGADGIRLAAASHAFALDEIERIAREEDIPCDFQRVPGFLFLAPGDSPELLSRELAACKEAGFEDVTYLAAGSSPLFPTGPCLRYSRQARFHAGHYLAGLLRAVRRKGGRVYAHTEAVRVEGGSLARTSTNRGCQILSEAVVLATNTPIAGRAMNSRLAPHRSYVVGIEIPVERQDPSLFWDTARPYHFVRSVAKANGTQLLLVGGADHRTGQTPPENPFAALTRWARDRLGVTGPLRYQWSGQVLEPTEGLAYIGRSPGEDGNVYVITGQSGNGLTYGTLAGRLLADLLAERANAWASLYAPSRIKLRSLGTYVSQNARAAAPYTDWLTRGDVGSPDEIPPGEGAVLREGLHKIAVYRDEHGRPHFFSAACPHRAGLVRWNGLEKTWDCPCHGSRFDCLGHLLNGPAETGLRIIDDNTAAEGESVPA